MMTTLKKILNQKTHEKFFTAANQIHEMIFSIYHHRDYVEKRYQYEKKLHKLRFNLMQIMQRARFVLTADALSQLENIYELLFSLGFLRLRITEHVTFEVSDREFTHLTQAIKKIFAALGRAEEADLRALSNAIDAFEIINQNTLQVVTYDPMVYLMFIQDLRMLSNALLLVQESNDNQR